MQYNLDYGASPALAPNGRWPQLSGPFFGTLERCAN